MKKLVFCICMIAILASCSTKTEGYVIDGELRGDVADSTLVFLRATDSSRNMIEVDTTYIINGAFEFTGTSNGPKLHYIFFNGIRGNSPIILENGEIRFRAQKDSLAYGELTGTPQNEVFMNYLQEQRKLSDIGQSMSRDLQTARAQGDQATMESLREEYFELQEKAKDFELEYIKSHPDALISALILERIAAQKAMPYNEVKDLYDQLSPEIKTSLPAIRTKELLENSLNTEVGAKAPEFSGPTPDGAELALSDVKGKVTLIDFWAGWCRPCRMENPNIVAVYEKYKDKGLEVIGVSLDRDRQKWLNAIEEDNLTWNHVSHVQYFQDPIAKLYNVNAIPAAFLLDENGVIVAKNLRGPALEAKVSELLN